jgi:hypothetical protein
MVNRVSVPSNKIKAPRRFSQRLHVKPKAAHSMLAQTVLHKQVVVFRTFLPVLSRTLASFPKDSA